MSSSSFEIIPVHQRPELLPIAAQYLFDAWPEINTIYGIHSPQDFIDFWIEEGRKFDKNESYEVTFMAVADGKFAGTVEILEDDMKGLRPAYTPWITILFVVPEFRKSGYGKRLMEFAQKYLALKGFDVAYIWMDKPAMEPTYLRMGFEIIERVVFHGYPTPIMRISLSKWKSSDNSA